MKLTEAKQQFIHSWGVLEANGALTAQWRRCIPAACCKANH